MKKVRLGGGVKVWRCIRVEDCKSRGVGECRSGGVGECRSGGVGECRSGTVIN